MCNRTKVVNIRCTSVQVYSKILQGLFEILHRSPEFILVGLMDNICNLKFVDSAFPTCITSSYLMKLRRFINSIINILEWLYPHTHSQPTDCNNVSLRYCGAIFDYIMSWNIYRFFFVSKLFLNIIPTYFGRHYVQTFGGGLSKW